MKERNDSIEFEDINKSFVLKRLTSYGGSAKSGTVQVLDGLTFDAKKGEVLGIIGRNGSGKSTLLKMVAGIIHPDSGRMEVSGKVASILELGMGFDPELTGRENLRGKCTMYGLTDKEIDASIEDMIQFSELGEQIDHPLRTYSSGMTAKLAFSVLISVKCDILVVDEVLSVGDAGFNAKCRMVFDRMRKQKKTVVIASHNLSLLEDMCDRVIWLEDGRIHESGDPASVCYRFQADATYSLETVTGLAETGDVSSQYRLGCMYRDGISVEKDARKAREWFMRASGMGHTDSMVALGDLEVQENPKAAEELYSKASVAGNLVATTRLASMDSSEVRVSVTVASRVRELADSGNSRAMKLLADLLANGTCMAKDPAEAIVWYRKAANRGDAVAMFSLGICYRDGIGVAKDTRTAREMLENASEHGNARARTELADMYRRGIGVERDMNKAIELYAMAADRGDAKSMSQLGAIYRDGTGVEADQSKADYWFSHYAKQARLNSEVALGDIVRQGLSGESCAECERWYRDAAEGGNIKAMVSLAGILRDGSIIRPDGIAAREWLQKAADLDNAGACYDLSLMFMRGESGAQDPQKARAYMKRAADLGNAKAVLQFALMCLRGYGGPKDDILADAYMLRAVENGSADARIELLTRNRA